MKNAVLKAICAGFEETTEPSLCLTPGQLQVLRFKCTALFCIFLFSLSFLAVHVAIICFIVQMIVS